MASGYDGMQLTMDDVECQRQAAKHTFLQIVLAVNTPSRYLASEHLQIISIVIHTTCRCLSLSWQAQPGTAQTPACSVYNNNNDC